MSESQSQRLIVAIHAALLVCIAWLVGLNWQMPGIVACRAWWAIGGILIGQYSLVAIWIALSVRPILTRSLGFFVLAPVLAAIYSNIIRRENLCGWWISEQFTSAARHMTWVAALGTLAVFVCVGLSAVRMIGFRLTNRRLSTEDRSPRRQFSIRHLVIWVTWLALLCGSWKWLTAHGWSAHGLFSRFCHGPHLPPAEFAALAIVTAMALLSPRRLRYTLPCLALAPIALSYLDAHYLPPWILDDIRQELPWSIYLCAYTAFGIIVGATLLWSRYRGYRLSWRPKQPIAPNAT